MKQAFGWTVAMCVLITFASCSTKNKIPRFRSNDLIMSLEKGSCLGKCAVYTLHIYKDKHALYEGKYNTDKLGRYYKLLPDSVFQSLEKEFQSAGFASLDSIYPSDIADFPSVTIGYRIGKTIKKVTFKENKPAEVSRLQRKMENIANSFDWVALQKTTEVLDYKPIQGKSRGDDGVNISSEIIIHPKDGISIDNWVVRYEGYKVKIVQKVAPNFNYYVISWDTGIINPDDMLLKLKGDPELKSAEFNKKIMQREP